MKIGYELEFFGASLPYLSKKYQLYWLKQEFPYSVFQLKSEKDITNPNMEGGELVSPIYTDLKTCQKELKDRLVELKNAGAYLLLNSEHTAFHIHLDRDIFKKDRERYLHFLKLIYVLQKNMVLFASGNGEIRKSSKDYAKLFQKEEIEALLKEKKIKEILKIPYKEYWIHFSYYHTVEFRLFNSSLEEERCNAYLNYIWNIGSYIENGNFYHEIDEVFYQDDEKKRERIFRLFL